MHFLQVYSLQQECTDSNLHLGTPMRRVLQMRAQVCLQIFYCI